MTGELYKLEWIHSLKTLQQGIGDTINLDAFMDVMVVCQDGVITHNKLVLGLLFPELSKVPVFDHPLEQTLILPDYNLNDIQSMILTLFPGADIVKDEDVETVHNNMVMTDNNFEQFLDTDHHDMAAEDSRSSGDGRQSPPWRPGQGPPTFGVRRGRGRPPLGNTARLPPRFTCDYCNKGFFYRSMLTQHEKLHTGGSRETCHLCGAEYSTRQNLKNHMIKHHGENTFTPRKRGRPPLSHDKAVTPSFSGSQRVQPPLRPHYRGRGRPPLMTKHPGLTHYAHAHNSVPSAESFLDQRRESEEELESIRSSVQQTQQNSQPQPKDDPVDVDIAEEPVDIKPDPDTLHSHPVTTPNNQQSTQNIIVFSNQQNVLNSDNSHPSPSTEYNQESQEPSDGGYQV